jgi:predicted  nucleic acid-binding Zn-ribbon protein
VSIDQQILSLERLATTDAEIKRLTEGIEKERGELDGLRVELGEIEERLTADQQSTSEMEKTRGDLIQELRQLSGQIDRSRERLNRSRNEREVNAAERELDELRKIQRDREDEIKKLAELGEVARAGMKEAEERKGVLTERLEGSLEGSTKTISELEGALAVMTSQRADIVKDLPSMLVRRYDRLWDRNKVPISKTNDGTCLGCFVKVSPMLFHQMLSRTKFEECPSCRRIFYYEPPPTEEELAAAAALLVESAPEEGDDGGDEAASDEASS